MEKESFIMYTSFNDLYFKELSREEKGLMIEAIFNYTENGVVENAEIIQDRTLRIAFNAIRDAIDRNDDKWAERKKARSDAAKARWEKQKGMFDCRVFQMPGDSAVELIGKTINMPKSFDELKEKTGINNYEQLRGFVDYCNHYKWERPLDEMLVSYKEVAL